MKVEKNKLKKEHILFEPFIRDYRIKNEKTPLIQNSVLTDYDRPHLVFSQKHRLNKEQVVDLVEHLQSWIITNSLKKTKIKTSDFGGAGDPEMTPEESLLSWVASQIPVNMRGGHTDDMKILEHFEKEQMKKYRARKKAKISRKNRKSNA